VPASSIFVELLAKVIDIFKWCIPYVMPRAYLNAVMGILGQP
jgi:hypothetical protein